MVAQTAALPPPADSFANSFWGKDDRGVTVLMNRLRNSKQTCQELQTMFTTRAAIEEEFGKKLLKLARTPLGKNEIGTLKDSLTSVKSELEISAKAHIDLAHQIKVELENTTNDFVNKQREKRKLQTSVIEKSSRNRSMIRSQLVKAKDRYDAEKLQGNMKDSDRLRSRLEKTHHSTRQADDDYKKTLVRLKEAQRRWEDDWRDACFSFQSLEEERLDFLRTHLWSYTNILSNVLVTEDESFERVRKTLERFSVSQDIQLFIDTHGTGKENRHSDPSPSNRSRAETVGSTPEPGQYTRSRSQSVSVQPSPFPTQAPPAGVFPDHLSGRRASAPGHPDQLPGPGTRHPPAPMSSNARTGGSRSRPVSVFHDSDPLAYVQGSQPTQPQLMVVNSGGAKSPGVPRPVSRSHTPGDSAAYLGDSFNPHLGNSILPSSLTSPDPSMLPRIQTDQNGHYAQHGPPRQGSVDAYPPSKDRSLGGESPRACPISQALSALSPTIQPINGTGYQNLPADSYGGANANGRTGSPYSTSPHIPGSPNHRYSPQPGAGHPSARYDHGAPPSPGRSGRQDDGLNVSTQSRPPFTQPGGANRIPTPVSLYSSSQSTPTTPTGGPPHQPHPQIPKYHHVSPVVGPSTSPDRPVVGSIPVGPPRAPPSIPRAPSASPYVSTSAPNPVQPGLQHHQPPGGGSPMAQSYIPRSTTPGQGDRPGSHQAPLRNFPPGPGDGNTPQALHHSNSHSNLRSQTPTGTRQYNPAYGPGPQVPPSGSPGPGPYMRTNSSPPGSQPGPGKPGMGPPGSMAGGSPRIPPAHLALQNSPQRNGPPPERGSSGPPPQIAPTPQRPPPPSAAPIPVPAKGPVIPRRLDATRPVLFYVRAMYDYASETPEEISIKQGAVISVLATHIDGWWEGETMGGNQQVQCGMFPSNFTEPLSF
ncbi:hypothetical protein BJ085DRAFT_41138 [Dimargaris cristalligena]|uniref:SH3 domain-containing protein n=1 Tax=Dimargaris cristalligena TaxID=215637 RepID=A0A4P9ZW24_9FUNG|nr:hypothetical protein BJ085DRAFT_41138 [Dimargaris cristalligena]|eukprot:RKP37846.1 hypothetical protein BJ085DRAFT_41138 [Dimargaris cristalligena]